MDYTITSETSTNVVSLGQPRAEVRRSLGTYRTFRRTTKSNEADHFMGAGAMATYADDGALMMLELVDPARVDVEGTQLLGMDLSVVEENLAAKGVRLEVDDLGAVIPSLSLGIYAPSGVVEGVRLGSD